MKQKMHFLVFIIIVTLLMGTLPSGSVQAGNNLGPGDAKLSQIKTYPCNTGTYYSGGVPTFTCSGWTGTVSWISVPVSTWDISPEYPLVGVPFYIGIGSAPLYRPGTNAAWSFSSRDVTFTNQIDFNGLRTEIRLVPVKQSTFPDWKYNGVLEYDYSSMGYMYGDLINYLGDKLDPENIYDDPETKSASAISGTYYPLLPGWGVDTMKLQAYASMSSYHAGNPSLYRGEPAYRMEITTYYEVQARASWSSYRLWERFKVGTKNVCRPGPNGAGEFDCRRPVGNWYEPGHYVSEDVYGWRWGAPQNGKDEDFIWVTVGSGPIEVAKVYWPDGSLHDHFPILVYQSQPILQEP
jgi:hypothetical protein